MTFRFITASLALCLFLSGLPLAHAEEDATSTAITVTAPTELPCGGTDGRARARCITDAIKAWAELQKEYDEQRDEILKEWKAEHSLMGNTAEYQRELRAFIQDLHLQRQEFQRQLHELRREFFARQEVKRKEGDGRKAQEALQEKLDPARLQKARDVCGKQDNDGRFRLCMRQQLRGHGKNLDQRSQTQPSAQEE